jgi:Cu2+-exporting ATPase/Cu+-exporting ATPase
MSGLLTPLVAVSAMLLSSISVIGNTLMLVRSEDRSQMTDDR